MDENIKFSLWLEFEHWQPEPDDDPEDEFFNMKVTLPSGKSYALSVWTFKFLERVIHSVRFDSVAQQEKCLPLGLTVEHPLEREYMAMPQLCVSRLDRKLIEEIVSHMLEKWNGELDSEWECEPPLEAEE